MNPITHEQSSWTQPAPSVACREPALRSAGSARSVLTNYLNNCSILSESHRETEAAAGFLGRTDVIEVREQQRVHYLDEQGRRRSHVFDLIVTFKNGHKVAYAVKPLAVALRQDLRTTLEQVAKFVPSAVADAVAILVESDVSGWRYSNATALYSVAFDPKDEPAYAAVRTAIGAAKTTIGEIVAATGMKGRAFRAILRLFRGGELGIADGPFDYSSAVWPVHAGEAV